MLVGIFETVIRVFGCLRQVEWLVGKHPMLGCPVWVTGECGWLRIPVK